MIEMVKAMNEVRDDDTLKRRSLFIFKEDIDLIDKILQMFTKRSQSKCAILIDKEGYLITMCGETQTYEMDPLCTLLAGTFAATREWAKLLGEEEFSVLFHQGKKDSIQVTLVGDRSLLAVIFDDRTQLGLVRLMCTEVAKKLTKVFEDAETKRMNSPPTPSGIDESFTESAKGLLDDLFNNIEAGTINKPKENS